jgi:hypothetical protein
MDNRNEAELSSMPLNKKQQTVNATRASSNYCAATCIFIQTYTYAVLFF